MQYVDVIRDLINWVFWYQIRHLDYTQYGDAIQDLINWVEIQYPFKYLMNCAKNTLETTSKSSNLN